MIVKLLPSQIPDYWEIIKYAAVTVNKLVGEKAIYTYCTNLLANLMADKFQAWIVYGQDKTIKTVLITRIYLDVGGIPHLMIDIAYGFNPSSEYDKIEGIGEIGKFAEKVGCESIIAYTSSPIAANAMVKMGMVETFKVYSRKVGV